MNKMEKELNAEYISIIKQMRELNIKRYEIFVKFKKLVPKAKTEMMRTPSIYHDLYGNDLDK
jgi:hypothetical protein